MAYQELLGRFYISSSLDNLSVGGNAISLTQGYYYLCGYTGEATNQLLEHLQAQIVAAGYASATCTRSSSTGYVTIDIGSTATITWTDTALQTLMGFTGTQSGASSYTGSQMPQHTWRPSETLTDYPGNSTNIWTPRSSSSVGRARDGTTWGVVGHVVYDARVTWDLLPEADVVKPSTGTIGKDLESWFEDVIHETQPVRLITDRTSYASTDDYVTAVVGDEEQETLGSFEDFKGRYTDEYQGLWTVTLPLLKYVS